MKFSQAKTQHFINKFNIIIIFFLLLFQSSYGQTDSTTKSRRIQNNSIYIELIGNGIPSFYTLNYERVFFFKKGYYIAGRIGAGYSKFMGTRLGTTPIILVNQYYQFSNCFLLEASFGWGYKWEYFDDYYDDPYDMEPNLVATHFLTGTIGFRYQGKKGFLLRIGFTPHYNFSENYYANDVQLLGGFSVGYSFPIKKQR